MSPMNVDCNKDNVKIFLNLYMHCINHLNNKKKSADKINCQVYISPCKKYLTDLTKNENERK